MCRFWLPQGAARMGHGGAGARKRSVSRTHVRGEPEDCDGVTDIGTTWEREPMKDSTNREQQTRAAVTKSGSGFGRRRHVADGAWRETVTHYMPEPWHVALEHEQIGPPVRPGHRLEASR